MIVLAVDLMGSDLGPEELCKGLRAFLKKTPDVSVLAYGDKDKLSDYLAGQDRVTIRPSEQVVPMEVSPMGFLRLKKSSMYLALQDAGKDPKIDGIVTSGSTGGFVIGNTLLVKNAPGVARAALAAPFITKVKGKNTVILDIGASNQNNSDELVEFAKMGAVYAKKIFGVPEPAIYLLSNGVEEGKGLKESVDAYHKLEGFPGFKGNCEARDVLDGTKDVVVTTGYPGNILLKSIEGTAAMMTGMMKAAFQKNLWTKIGYLFARSGLKEMKEQMDYRKTGGAILLGINKVAVKAHGNSNAYAFENALNVAYRMCQSQIVSAISEALGD